MAYLFNNELTPEALFHYVEKHPLHQAFQPRGKQSRLSLRRMFENVCNLCLFLLINAPIICAFLFFYRSSKVLHVQKSRQRGKYHIYLICLSTYWKRQANIKGWHKRGKLNVIVEQDTLKGLSAELATGWIQASGCWICASSFGCDVPLPLRAHCFLMQRIVFLMRIINLCMLECEKILIKYFIPCCWFVFFTYIQISIISQVFLTHDWYCVHIIFLQVMKGIW